jgi:hypothetical protein
VAKTQRNRGNRDQRDHGKAQRTDEMHSVFSLAVFSVAPGLGVPVSRRQSALQNTAMLTRKARFRPMTDTSWSVARGGGCRHGFTTLANPASFTI